MGIKAVAFDYGNVISAPQGAETMGLLASIAGVTEAEMEKLVWGGRADYDRGTLSGTEYYRKGLAALGKEADEGTLMALVRTDLESWASLNSETLAIMEELRGKGLKLAILSNIPHEFLALAKKRFPIFSNVDVGIFSCELGAIKPEVAIYEALLGKLGVSAAEAIFFDDLERNIEGAQKAGITAFLWKDAAAARAELARLGVL